MEATVTARQGSRRASFGDELDERRQINDLREPRMKRVTIFLIVVPLMIGIFLLTRGSIPAGQTSLVWALVGTGLLIAAFLLVRREKPK
jgi:ABC-type enterobactin transport system permease subunit